MLLGWFYLILSLLMGISSMIMMRPSARMTVRALGLIIGFLAAGIALKAQVLLAH